MGIRNPKPAKLEAIAKALGVNVEVLLNSECDDISAMHRLFQLFRQYEGYFVRKPPLPENGFKSMEQTLEDLPAGID